MLLYINAHSTKPYEQKQLMSGKLMNMQYWVRGASKSSDGTATDDNNHECDTCDHSVSFENKTTAFKDCV